MMADYIPEIGDFVWITFDPQAGHEQSGRRPALVLSPNRYNRLSGLCLVCPVTSKKKNYPFEVQISSSCAVTGVVLADHVKSLDWRARRVELITQAPKEVLHETLDKLFTLFPGDD